MIVASQIYLKTSDTKALSQLKAALTYPNPKYQDAKRMGLYLKNIPETIQTYGYQGEYLKIPRGYFALVKKLFPDEPVEDRTIKHPKLDLVYENKTFELDERQKRCVEAMVKKKQGIIHAATSAGKSAIILAAIAEINQPTLIIVHRKMLLNQLYEDARKWIQDGSTKVLGKGVRQTRTQSTHESPLFGQIGAGKNVVGKITFAIDKSLAIALKKDPTLPSKFGLVIQDECHQSPCSTFQRIMDQLPATKRFGLTGTLKRKDRMDFLIGSTYGAVISTVTKDELLKADRVSPVFTEVIYSDATVPEAILELQPTQKSQAIDKVLHVDEERLTLIIDYVQGIIRKRPDARIAICSRYVDPCYRLRDLASERDIACSTITGRDSDGDTTCARLRSGNLQLAVVTLGCFSTGINIPELTDIVLISPCFSNELLIHQLRGRLYRKAVGKTHGTLHLVWDQFVFPSWKLNRFKSIMKN